MEDSDSNDSAFWTNNDVDPPKIPKMNDEVSESAETAPSLENVSTYSTNIDEPAKKKKEESPSERMLAIEEAKLQVQREKLKLMKTIADDLSAIHRDFLKAYRNKWMLSCLKSISVNNTKVFFLYCYCA